MTKYTHVQANDWFLPKPTAFHGVAMTFDLQHLTPNPSSVMTHYSSVVLFADDIVLYRVITSIEDYAQLQSDIDSIAD